MIRYFPNTCHTDNSFVNNDVINEAWQYLVNAEEELRAYLKKQPGYKSDPPLFIGQFHATVCVQCDQEGMHNMLLALSKADQQCFVFPYHDGFVMFSGYDSTSILSLFKKIYECVHSNVMQDLIRTDKDG